MVAIIAGKRQKKQQQQQQKKHRHAMRARAILKWSVLFYMRRIIAASLPSTIRNFHAQIIFEFRLMEPR